MSLKMSTEAREAFLRAVHVGVIGIEREDAPPIAVPIWYDYDPAVGLWVLTGAESEKGRALRAAGRFSLCAQSEEAPFYRYVSVEGPIISTRPADREKDSRRMAHRYFGKELGDTYVDSQDEDGSLVFTMRPERWRTVDYGQMNDGHTNDA